MVRALPSHQCDPDLISRVDIMLCGLSLLLVLVLALRVFLWVLQFSTLHQTQHFQIPIQPATVSPIHCTEKDGDWYIDQISKPYLTTHKNEQKISKKGGNLLVIRGQKLRGFVLGINYRLHGDASSNPKNNPVLHYHH